MFIFNKYLYSYRWWLANQSKKTGFLNEILRTIKRNVENHDKKIFDFYLTIIR